MAIQKRMLLLGSEAREYLLQGIIRLSSAVKVTLGAEGRHVVIEDSQYNYPVITRDGVAVAESISFGDNRLEQGAKMAKDAARECWRDAGDGTTSTIIMTETLCKSVNDYLQRGKNPNALAKGIRQAARDAVEAINNVSVKVDKNSLFDVAVVSANNDEEIGRIVADIVWEVGENGSVIIKQGKDKTKVDVLQGSIFKGGYISKEFANNDGSRSEYDPLIFVTDFSFSKAVDIVTLLEAYNKRFPGQPVVIIGREFLGDARSILVHAYKANRIPVVAVEAPFEGEQMRDALRDIATATGATFLGEEKGYAIGDMMEGAYFGKCKRVEVYDNESRFVGGHGDPKVIQTVVDGLMMDVAKCESSEEENLLKERIAWLTGKVAIVNVGGDTPTEKISKMHRLDDSIRSSKAALDDGMIIGGGAAYLYAHVELTRILSEGWNTPENDNNSYWCGYEAMMEALMCPTSQILANAAVENVESTLDEVYEMIAKGTLATYNVMKQEMEVSGQTHILDSAKVIKTAITKAASVGAVFATTEVLNYDEYNYYANLKENAVPVIWQRQ